MKKKLLLFAVALLCSAASWAELDVTSTYLTNADFSSGKTGWNGIKDDSGSNKNSSFVLVSNQTFGKGSNDNNAEMWIAQNSQLGSGDINQTLSNVTAGVYRLSIKVRSDVKFYLYASIGGVEQHLFSETVINPVEERSLVFVVNKASDVTIGVKNGESINTYNWIAIDDFKMYREGDISSSVDVTNQIVNWDFTGCSSENFPGWTILAENGTKTNLGETRVEYWIATASEGSFDYYQNLTALPKGKYTLAAYMWNTTNANGSGTSVNGECGVYGKNSNGETFKGVNPDSNGQNPSEFSTDPIIVSDGDLRLGVKNNTTMGGQWFGVDWIKLYYDPYISVIAPDFSSGSEMAAGQWYKFTVDAAGDYGFDVIDGIVLTSNGNQALSEATGDALTHTVALSTGATYYIKSTTAQTVTKSGKFTYTIGTGASDKSYIQAGNTVTISYASMTTTNTYTEELDSEISGVTFGGNAISVSRTTKGFTFTVPTVTAGTEYTLAIPAGVIGYKASGSGTNAAQNITLNTPAILDGTYFFKANSTYKGSARSVTAACGKYLARGNASGTHATIDKYGLPIIVTTDNSNVTTLQPADTRTYYYHHDPGNQNWHCWADRSSADNNVAKFNVTLHDGEYRLRNVSMDAGRYFKYNDQDVNADIITVFDDGNGTNSGPIINWSIETASEHATVMAALKNSQAETAATAAYASGSYASLNGITSISALEAELSENYTTTAVVSATEISTVTEKFQEDEQVTTPKNVMSGSVEISTPGLYKFSIQAFYRASGNVRVQEMHTAGIDFPHVVVFFGDAETQIKSVYDESSATALTEENDWTNLSWNNLYYPNSTSTALPAFQADMYHNDVYFYVSEAGTYNYGVKYLDYAASNDQWFIYTPQSVSITGYTIANADADDYAALASAIADAEDHTIGFEEDEYAPYNNKGIFSILETAKAIDPSVDNYKYAVNASTTALNSFEWSQNATELNAFCGGDFSQYQTVYNSGDSRNEDYPYGWNLYHGDKNRSRIMGGTEGSSNTGLSASSSGKALLLKFNATYGESEGYTMPLKAATLYKITFKHGRWAEGNPRVTDVVMTDPDGASITLAPGFQAETNDCQSNSGNWYTYTGYFVSTKAGDYKFNLTKQGGNSQMQIAIADIDLRTAEDITFADGSVPTYAPGTYPSVKISRTLTADRWATAIYPFAVSGVDDIAVLDSYDKTKAALGFKSASASTANEPFLMRSTANTTEISLSNVEVATADATLVTKSEASLIGTYVSTDITNAEKNYVLSSNVIYPVGGAAARINPYRAYIQIAQDPSDPSGVRALTFFIDDEATAIEGIDVKEPIENATIYNLAGQRVQNATKGIYIVNGKKVIVK